MRMKVFLFYAVAILSLSMFAFSPAASDLSSEHLVPDFQVTSALIESANLLAGVRY